MPILAIDTTGVNCSVGLRVAGLPDVIVSDAIGRGHAERLAPMVANIIANSNVEPKALTRIAVAVGPGSFAGSRVGVSFARGLALSTGALALGLNNLEIIAAGIDDTSSLAVLHDAKRGEVIVQTWSGGICQPPERLKVDAVAAYLQGHIGAEGILAGSGAHLIRVDGFIDSQICELDLCVMLDMLERADDLKTSPSPFYARPPDAKLPGGINP